MRSYIVFLVIEGTFALLGALTWSTTSLYHATVVKLSPVQLVLVGTVLEATAFISEIPTGVVADVYSRRLSVIVSTFMVGIGLIVQSVIPIFSVIVLAQVVLGIGWTFRSGAIQAWLMDEIGEVPAGRAIVRAGQIDSAAALVGLVVGATMGNSLGVRMPIFLGGCAWLGLGLFLIFAMKEHRFKSQSHPNNLHNAFQALWRTLIDSIRMICARRIVLIAVLIYLLTAFGGEGIYRLWVLHTITNMTLPSIGALQPVVWTSIMEGGGMVFAFVLMGLVRQQLNLQDNRAVSMALFAGTATMMAATYVFSFTNIYFVGMLMFWIETGISRCLEPVLQAWSSQHIAGEDSRLRATVFSAFGFADGLGSAAGGPIIGCGWELLVARRVRAFGHAWRTHPFSVLARQ